MKYSIALAISFCISLLSCSKEIMRTSLTQSPQVVFDEFWEYVDERYIFFELKGVDWDEVYARYSAQIKEEMSEQELFTLCRNALLELRDGHNRIETHFAKESGFRYTDGFEIHFSLDLIRNEYADGALFETGNLRYNILADDIGYVHFTKMNRYGQFANILKDMKEEGIQGVVIDLRNNGGGDSNSLPELLSDFVNESTLLGHYIEKTGPAHNDISEPLSVYAEPSTDYFFDLPIVAIINRRSFSATSYFASILKQIPKTKVIGQITGGGAGGNIGYQLSNGWIVAVSTSDFLNVNNESIEQGVIPEIEVQNNAQDIEEGIDRMLEMAIEEIKNY